MYDALHIVSQVHSLSWLALWCYLEEEALHGVPSTSGQLRQAMRVFRNQPSPLPPNSKADLQDEQQAPCFLRLARL